MRKILIHIMLLMVTVAVSSCVYPFEPELDKSSGRNLVIEGDLLIGSFSYIRLSYMSYLDEDLAEWDVKAEVRAEDEKGNMYNGKKVDSNLYLISLNLADPSSRFRLYVVLDDGREYASEWAEARRAPVVDEITHELDATTNQVRFNITLHSDDGEQYFRWFFDEDWEYESLYDAKYWYSIDTSDPDDNGTMIKYGPREGTHYCWMNQQSTGLYFTTTRDLESNKVQEKNFYRVAAQTQRMSSLYSMNVRVESTTEDCYDYWKNVRTNSENLGDLFSPIPSEMRGNIYNLSDPDETVLGFVNVSTVAEKRVFVDNKKTGYYIKKTYIPEDDWMIEVPTNEWRRYYIYKQYLPVSKGEGSIFYWAPKRCVDCRLQGGTKNRPVFWPNDHY
ncbi:MAG: DUF4249 family protein [Bacteroidales bacterium]|nr:DUF4249 family protein [Bacteroidales bacterium]MBR5072261.1 DUF4249 family protein [Bacteroidales bacterium]